MKTYVVNITLGDDYDVFIGRPTCWGNPFHIGKDGTKEEVVEKYKKYILANKELFERAQNELKGKVLGCYCNQTTPCHGKVLADIANGILTIE